MFLESNMERIHVLFALKSKACCLQRCENITENFFKFHSTVYFIFNVI